MIRLVVLVVTIFLSTHVFAAIDCKGVPQAVKMGEYGNQEAFVMVRINNLDYRLGTPDNPTTKIRVSLAQTALVSGTELKLRYWAASTCEQASTGEIGLNSVQLVK